MADNSDDDYGGSDYSDDFDNMSLDDYEFEDVPNLPTVAGLDGYDQDNTEPYDDINDDDDDDGGKIFPESTSAEDIELHEGNVGDAAFQSVTTNKEGRSVTIADSVFQTCHESVEGGGGECSLCYAGCAHVDCSSWSREVCL